METTSARKDNKRYLAGTALAALGVVFGDIGTSPLYALKECFAPHRGQTEGLATTHDNVLGILSMVIWTLTIIVSIKYMIFVLRADHKGEGGIMTLVSLVFLNRKRESRATNMLILMGLFGAALLYGDGMITPAISVLSAVEGLREVRPISEGIEPFIVPITIVILIGLFYVQRFGTAKVAKVFGPITLVWFLTLGALGVYGVWKYNVGILAAFSPYYAYNFVVNHAGEAMPVMGSVFLAVTGAEALYADMGHFGVKPIRLGWWFVVMPCLILNYLGQGALILAGGLTDHNSSPLFKLAPDWFLIPLVLLATVATVIASQALITGAYSVTMQAVQLGYLPRIRILHTSKDERGQIYMPTVAGFLMVACIGLVLAFGSSGELASAYGIAVTLTMLISTCLFCFVARHQWRWSMTKLILICLPFLVIEGVFVYSNLLKFVDGGWFPIAVGIIIFTVMTTWKKGRSILRDKIAAGQLPLGTFVKDIRMSSSLIRVNGTAVFMAGNPSVTPLALLHNLKHNKVLHKRVIFLSIVTETVPHVAPANRATIEDLGEGCWSIIGHYGYMEEPNVTQVLEVTKTVGFDCDMRNCTFFLSRETIVTASTPGLPLWRAKLFGLLSKNAQPATAFFRLPPNRVVELGMQIEI